MSWKLSLQRTQYREQTSIQFGTNAFCDGNATFFVVKMAAPVSYKLIAPRYHKPKTHVTPHAASVPFASRKCPNIPKLRKATLRAGIRVNSTRYETTLGFSLLIACLLKVLLPFHLFLLFLLVILDRGSLRLGSFIIRLRNRLTLLCKDRLYMRKEIDDGIELFDR